MKTVGGKMFGSGQMQLPVCGCSPAEVMKTAVALSGTAHGEVGRPDSGKGRIVLATVKGDRARHRKENLVDIILRNNGYEVVNIASSSRSPNSLEVAEDTSADVVGMSGLLVENPPWSMRKTSGDEHPRSRREVPVAVGGAARPVATWRNDLTEIYQAKCITARDALRALKLPGHHHEAPRVVRHPDVAARRKSQNWRKRTNARPATSDPSASEQRKAGRETVVDRALQVQPTSSPGSTSGGPDCEGSALADYTGLIDESIDGHRAGVCAGCVG